MDWILVIDAVASISNSLDIPPTAAPSDAGHRRRQPRAARRSLGGMRPDSRIRSGQRSCWMILRGKGRAVNRRPQLRQPRFELRRFGTTARTRLGRRLGSMPALCAAFAAALGVSSAPPASLPGRTAGGAGLLLPGQTGSWSTDPCGSDLATHGRRCG